LYNQFCTTNFVQPLWQSLFLFFYFYWTKTTERKRKWERIKKTCEYEREGCFKSCLFLLDKNNRERKKMRQNKKTVWERGLFQKLSKSGCTNIISHIYIWEIYLDAPWSIKWKVDQSHLFRYDGHCLMLSPSHNNRSSHLIHPIYIYIF